MALSTAGGGDIVMDPTGDGGARALEKLFQLELRFDAPVDVSAIGGRVHVRFDHGEEALAARIYRSVRQVFLKRFNV